MRSLNTFFMLGPALARVMPAPAQITRWRAQIKDIFHVEELPYGTFRNVAACFVVMGFVEVAFVKPVREDKVQKQRLQEHITRSHLEKMFAKEQREQQRQSQSQLVES